MAKLDDLARVELETRAKLRRWLERHHDSSPGFWLVSAKKATGRPRIEYDAIVEELLCFGWVDSLPRKLDEARTMLLCTPRKPGSRWSRLNKERVEKMLALGKMAPRGLEVLTQAKQSGAWAALDAVEALEIPEDLAARLDALPPARAHFEAFPRSVKRGILEWILSAKRPVTRAKRVEQTATMAQKNERANQWPRK